MGAPHKIQEPRNASCARGIGAKVMSASCPSLLARTPRGRNSRKGKNALRVAPEGSSLAIESPSREYSGRSDQPHVEPRPAFCLHKRVRKSNPPKTKIAYEQHVGGTPQGRKHTVIIGRVWSLFLFFFHSFLTRSLTLKVSVDARERQTGVPKFEDDVSAR